MKFSSRTQICSVMCLLGYSKHFTVTLLCPLQELCPSLSVQSCRTCSFAWTTFARKHQAHTGQEAQVWAFSSKPLYILVSPASFSSQGHPFHIALFFWTLDSKIWGKVRDSNESETTYQFPAFSSHIPAETVGVFELDTYNDAEVVCKILWLTW